MQNRTPVMQFFTWSNASMNAYMLTLLLRVCDNFSGYLSTCYTIDMYHRMHNDKAVCNNRVSLLDLKRYIINLRLKSSPQTLTSAGFQNITADTIQLYFVNVNGSVWYLALFCSLVPCLTVLHCLVCSLLKIIISTFQFQKGHRNN